MALAQELVWFTCFVESMVECANKRLDKEQAHNYGAKDGVTDSISAVKEL
jgi:hypothetical protein